MMRLQVREVHGEEADIIQSFQPMTILRYFEKKENLVIVPAELL